MLSRPTLAPTPRSRDFQGRESMACHSLLPVSH
jgi:hypothetical protein